MPSKVLSCVATLAALRGVLGHHVPPCERKDPGPGGMLLFQDEKQGFWFTCGFDPEWIKPRDDPYILLLDTFSGDLLIDSYRYQPDDNQPSVTGPEKFSITFNGTNLDGSGNKTFGGKTHVALITFTLGSSTEPQMEETFELSQVLGAVDTPLDDALPHDGVLGLGAKSTLDNVWHNICGRGQLNPCRFGLALNADQTGEMYFGKVPHDVFEGNLSVTELHQGQHIPLDPLELPPTQINNGSWQVLGDVLVNGKEVASDHQMFFTTASSVIFGPITAVKDMFNEAGIEWVHSTDDDNQDRLDGFYPCDNPPVLQFGFPSLKTATEGEMQNNSHISHNRTLFGMLPESLEQSRTGNNCTAIIHGSDTSASVYQAGFDCYTTSDCWIIGQAFFQGKYIDHNTENKTMGFANLKSAGFPRWQTSFPTLLAVFLLQHLVSVL